MTSRMFALILVTALACGCATQHGGNSSPARGASPSAFFAVSVADIDRMSEWYRKTLDLDVQSEGVAPGGRIRFVLLQRDGALVELLQLPDARPRSELAPAAPDAAQIHGVYKAGFVVADLDAEYARLERDGVAFEFPIVKPPQGPYRVFGLRDPEGNLIQIFGR